MLCVAMLSILTGSLGGPPRSVHRSPASARKVSMGANTNVVLIDQALTYAARGFSIIPVCGKLPAISWKEFQTRRMAEPEIEKNFSTRKVTGIATVLGPVSGDLACRDFDAPASYGSWRSRFPKEADSLPTIKTPDGYHVYFRWSGVRTIHLADGELRGTRSYCLLPPSVFHGQQYTFLKPFGDEILNLHPFNSGLSQSWNRANRANRSGQSEQNAVGTVATFSKTTIRSLEQAVSVAVPLRAGQNHERLWVLARGLLSLQHHLGRNLSEQERIDAFSLWYEQAASHLRPGQSRDEYLAEFLEALERARYPLGEGQFVSEAWRAASTSQPPADAVSRLSEPRFLLLASFCRELQRRAGTGPFYLSSRTVQERFELASHVTGYRWLMFLVRLKILEITERGTPGLKGRATRFRYLPPVQEGAIQ